MKKTCLFSFAFFLTLNILAQTDIQPTPTPIPTLDKEVEKKLQEYREKYKNQKTEKSPRPERKKFYTNEELKIRKQQREAEMQVLKQEEQRLQTYQSETKAIDDKIKKLDDSCNKKKKQEDCDKIKELQGEKVKLLCKHKVFPNACELLKKYEDQFKTNKDRSSESKTGE